MPRKPGQTREATRAAIIDAAEKVFTDKGFAGASLSTIAKEAGVTKSLIHYHFTSKEALWQEIKEDRFKEYAVEQQKIFGEPGPAREFLAHSFSAYFHFLQQNPHFLRLMWWMQAEHGRSQHPDHDLKVSESMSTLVHTGMEYSRAAQERGEVRGDLEPRFMFAAFLSLLRHWFVARRDFRLVEGEENQNEADERYLNTIIEIFLHGVLPR
ncbi:TetR/AcrR family transcriptional regulator [Myxococcota bacterium]